MLMLSSMQRNPELLLSLHVTRRDGYCHQADSNERSRARVRPLLGDPLLLAANRLLPQNHHRRHRRIKPVHLSISSARHPHSYLRREPSERLSSVAGEFGGDNLANSADLVDLQRPAKMPFSTSSHQTGLTLASWTSSLRYFNTKPKRRLGRSVDGSVPARGVSLVAAPSWNREEHRIDFASKDNYPIERNDASEEVCQKREEGVSSDWPLEIKRGAQSRTKRDKIPRA